MKRAIKLDMKKIAEGLGAERRGKVTSTGGYFGAMQLAAEVEARFRTPTTGGRATDPKWTDKRLVPMAAKTLSRLKRLADDVNARSGRAMITPLQVAAILLEEAAAHGLDEQEVLARVRARTG